MEIFNNVKDDFPIFKSNPTLSFLDNASTTQTPLPVIKKLNEYYNEFNAGGDLIFQDFYDGHMYLTQMRCKGVVPHT